jgi:hypothetical protein
VRLYRLQLASMMVKDAEDAGERDAMIQVCVFTCVCMFVCLCVYAAGKHDGEGRR